MVRAGHNRAMTDAESLRLPGRHRHAACGDRRRSLSVGVIDGRVVAHCFKCGFSYRSPERGGFIAAPPADERDDARRARLLTPRAWDYTDDAYLAPAYLGRADAAALGLTPAAGGMLIAPPSSGFAALRVYAPDRGPKWLAVRTPTCGCWFGTTRRHDTLLIAEDPLSAYRAHRDAGVDALALLQLGLRSSAAVYAAQYKNAIVWLDNDRPRVVVAAHRVVSALLRAGFGGRAHRVTDHADPKLVAPGDLRRIVARVAPTNGACAAGGGVLESDA